MNNIAEVIVHVHPGDAHNKFPGHSELGDLVEFRNLTFYCRNVEHARRLVNALNNVPERDLNISLIDAMFLIWSLRLMTNLSWEEVYDFVYDAIGIGGETSLALFHEADKRIGPKGAVSRCDKAFKLKHDGHSASYEPRA